MTSPLKRDINDFFGQVRHQLLPDVAEPSVFKLLLHLLTSHDNAEHQRRVVEQLEKFGEKFGVPIKMAFP